MNNKFFDSPVLNSTLRIRTKLFSHVIIKHRI